MTFDEWWEKESGWGGESLCDPSYHLAKAAWNKAIGLAATMAEDCEGTDFGLRAEFFSP